MNGTSTSKVERWQIEQPAVCVPGPASDRAVDNGGPDESEDQRWHNSASLERTTNDELDGTSTEEHLIETKHNLWEQCGPRRWCRHDVLQTKVIHVPDKSIGGARVGEGVTPEHPLKAGACVMLAHV